MLWHKAPRESDQLTLLRAETSSIWAALSADTASHRGSHAAGLAPRCLSVRLPSSLSCTPISAPICLPWLYLFPTVGNEINVLRIPGLWGINLRPFSKKAVKRNCTQPGKRLGELSLEKVRVKVAQSRPTHCDPVDYPHGILQARILEWVASPFSRVLPY